MESKIDYEKIWFLYQTEGAPKGVSINSFCESHGIHYHDFERWFKSRHRTVAPIEIIGMPSEEKGMEPGTEAEPETDNPKSASAGIVITISTSDGVRIRKNVRDYEDLIRFVGRLEGLC